MPLRRHVQGRLTNEQRLRRLVEDVLVGTGLSETYSWSLVAGDPDPGAIRVPVPLSAEQGMLRTTLLHGLIESARTTVDAGTDDARLFEIARVYLPSGEQLPAERWRVGAIVAGGFAPAREVVETLYTALKLPLEVERTTHASLHPGKAAGTEAGWLGELHPTLLEGVWGVLELDLGILAERMPERIVYDDVITYPAVRQDIAVAVDEDVEAGDLVAAAREAAGPLLRDVRPFDVFHGAQLGAGKKSVALRLAFQSYERTLTDDDAAKLRARIVEALAERFGAELRA
jgi:phenylalanyl-tRNA synthetase beta chain